MRLVVPGAGWSWAFGLASELTGFGLLGPFADYDVIREVRISVGGLNNGQCYVGLVHGATAQANAAAFAAGTSLIQRSNVDDADGQPMWRIAVAAFRTWEMCVPCGFKGTSGSRYVIVRVVNVSAGNMFGLATAWVERVLREPKE